MNAWLTKTKGRKGDRALGFTLVELLVVVVIIAVLAAIAIPIFLNQKTKAQEAATEATVSAMADAIAAGQSTGGTIAVTESAMEVTDGTGATVTVPIPVGAGTNLKVVTALGTTLTGTSIVAGTALSGSTWCASENGATGNVVSMANGSTAPNPAGTACGGAALNAGSGGGGGGPVVYAVGDAGPGGGKIFLTPSSVGNSTGKYFEIADVTWDGGAGGGGYPGYQFCNDSNGNPGGMPTDTAIGAGATNTATVIAAGCATPSLFSAVTAYNGGGKTDWFVPSQDELLAAINSGQLSATHSNAVWTSSTSPSSTTKAMIFQTATLAVDTPFSLTPVQKNKKYGGTAQAFPMRSFAP